MNQHPKSLDELAAWIRDGKVEKYCITNGWMNCSQLVINEEDTWSLTNYRRKPDPVVRPLRCWVSVKPNDNLQWYYEGTTQLLSHGFDSREAVENQFGDQKDRRTIEMAEVLPPVKLGDSEAYQIWENVKSGSVPGIIRSIARQLSQRAPVKVKRVEWTDDQCAEIAIKSDLCTPAYASTHKAIAVVRSIIAAWEAEQ